jgi:hypothetical protein
MENSVNEQDGHFFSERSFCRVCLSDCRGNSNDHIAEWRRAYPCADGKTGVSDGERQDIGGFVFPTISTIQPAHPLITDERHAQVRTFLIQ